MASISGIHSLSTAGSSTAGDRTMSARQAVIACKSRHHCRLRRQAASEKPTMGALAATAVKRKTGERKTSASAALPHIGPNWISVSLSSAKYAISSSLVCAAC
ncbi:hypothetical protein OI25_2788 [Paraburkholderia fungorum]|uniref:Uncharacterized protein n=1 Tax=Paraburkholderia fungorum TaxID=134537 RepID=A0AAU8T3R8_9BURK|nr:hypothetical protein OI25_2788 [Paraburkholderia fungorum]